MGKGDRKTKARRNKPPMLPGVAPVPRKQPNGRTRRTVQDRDTTMEALKARCRQMGMATTDENLREARAPWYGCNAGRVIGQRVTNEAERAELWDAICVMRKITASYDAALGAPRRHATCLRLLAPVEEMSADASTPAKDDRTDEEKQRHAVSRWAMMQGWLGYTDAKARSEALRVVLDDAAVSDPLGLLMALRCVSEGLTGKRIAFRGRY